MMQIVQEAKLRGLPTTWLESGPSDAPTVLALHGFPDGPDTFEYQMDVLSKEYHVVVPHLRGTRGSDTRQLQRMSLTSQALDMLQILNQIDPRRQKPLHIVAHDLAVPLAWELATLTQGWLTTLTVINGLSLRQIWNRFKSNPKQIAKSWYIFSLQIPGVGEALEKWASHYIENQLEKVGRKKTAEFHISAWPTYKAYLRSLPDILKRRNKAIDTPVQVIWGQYDAFLTTPTQDEFEVEARNVEMRILKGQHWIHHSQPGDVNRYLLSFFERHK